MRTRTAILLDEDGKEIYRGHPANMPVRFVSEDGQTIYEWTMNEAVEAGTPIDPDDGSDMEIHDAG